ncbi:hypothetical protein CL618_03825 [archaeon]|nr:hypothetical protein [archaeon]
MGMFREICSIKNLEKAFERAKKGKGRKRNILEFEKNLKENLELLRIELLLKCYSPRSMKTFVIRDPKTRKISASDFRDRVIHHALFIIIEDMFDKSFICDSFANRKFKGSLKAIERFDEFKRKINRNNSRNCYVLKADIKHYFQTVDHEILLKILKRKIKDREVIWLIERIIKNYSDKKKGMPLGNLTSQFFANVYLNELDWFVKNKLKIKYYIRYVDDFVILYNDCKFLEKYKKEIDLFLKEDLKIELHPEKSKIICLKRGVNFLGFRIFYNYRLLKKSNIKNFRKKYERLKKEFIGGKIDYDKVYDFIEGWLAYAKKANTCKLRKKIVRKFEKDFPNELSIKEYYKIKKYSR